MMQSKLLEHTSNAATVTASQIMNVASSKYPDMIKTNALLSQINQNFPWRVQ